ncbi:MAG: TlpA family protein disulfide reductase [Thermomicrobium sp.]|nr:TlpA family protein disulfide reductase [Thermomicrobium sp.]
MVGLLVLAFVGFLAYAMHQRRGSSELGAGGRINTVGSLVRFADREAPSFALPNLRGGPEIRLADHQGSVVVLNFWGSWCPPCREEAPVLEQFAKQTSQMGIVLIGIDVWERNWSEGRAFLDEFGLSYPNAYDATGHVTIDYGVSGVPETFIISREGRLLGKYTGPVESVEQLMQLLTALGALPTAS